LSDIIESRQLYKNIVSSSVIQEHCQLVSYTRTLSAMIEVVN